MGPKYKVMLIKEEEIRDSKRIYSTYMQLSSMNLYIALWRSISASYKNKMLSRKKLIGTDGPTLFWVLFKTYQGTIAQVIRKSMKELKILPSVLKDKYYDNVDKLCDHGLIMIMRLVDARGIDSQLFEKLYEVFYTILNFEFNLTISSLSSVWSKINVVPY